MISHSSTEQNVCTHTHPHGHARKCLSVSSVGGRCAVLDICTRVDVNVTRVILTVINCGPYGVCFIAIDGLKARDMRFCISRRISHTVK